MDAASIEEINKLRVANGMKPLPVPGAAPPAPSARADDEEEEDPGSTLESREAQAYDNYQREVDAQTAKKKREEKAAAVKKAREQAQRFAVLEGKGLGDLDDGDDGSAKSWLKGQKKRQKKIDQERHAQEEKSAAAAARAATYTAKDLAGVKVGHEMSEILDGDEQVLTLKDAGILDEEDEDELEILELREQEKLNENIKLKKKKPLYDPYEDEDDEERSVLAKYDEEIGGKKNKKLFVLSTEGSGSTDLADILQAPIQNRKSHMVNLDSIDENAAPSSDYLDVSEVKIKKSKKKKSKSTRRRGGDDEDALLPEGDVPDTIADQQMDIDSGAVSFVKKRKTIDETFVDDEDLQATLAIQRRSALKKRKMARPEDLARQLRQEVSRSPEPENEDGKGLVIDEISGFVSALRKSGEDESDRRVRARPIVEQPVTDMNQDSDEDEDMKDVASERHESVEREAAGEEELGPAGMEDEKSIASGVGAALQLLRDRGLLKEQHGAELNEQYVQKQLFLAERQKRMALYDEQARQQRERDRASGRFERMSAREREDWQRQQNANRDLHLSRVLNELYNEGYRPDVDIKYVDDHGRRLDQKGAFKHLSHAFHGKGSGKGKTDKMLKKIEEEKRREAQSILDVSQNVGMSSAAAQQIKKRKEAGVRLA